MNTPLNFAVIGANGGRGLLYAEVLKKRSDVHLVACVVNKHISHELQALKCDIITDGNVQRLLDNHTLDYAVVSLPHHLHSQVTKLLRNKGVKIIKEKPLALSLKEAESYDSRVFTTVQRTVMKPFIEAKMRLSEIGSIQSFSYTYTFNLPSPTSGWRSDPEKAGGGVVMDMGYHIIDIVQWLVGKPNSYNSTVGYEYDEMKEKALEDRAHITFSYKTFRGSITLDRHAKKKEERFEIIGENGTIVLEPTSLSINGKKEEFTESKEDLISNLYDLCLNEKTKQEDFDRNINTVRIIEKLYADKAR